MDPTVYVCGARAAYLGPGLKLKPHKLAAGVIAVGLDQPSVVHFPDMPRSEDIVGSVIFIPPDRLHRLSTRGRMFFLYLDALEARRLDCLTVAENAGSVLARMPEQLTGTGLADMVSDVCELTGLVARSTVDQRMMNVVRKIDRDPDCFETVVAAAVSAGLSTSRFQHLFVAATGVSFRRYRLWRRMALVADALSDGVSLTVAAHDAGFSSSAHLSTAFRKMFGLSPSRLLKAGVRFEVAPRS